MLTVKCPTCGGAVAWGEQSPFRPFCSDRCRLIDLGEWFAEQRAIAGPPVDDLSDPSGPVEPADDLPRH